MWLGGGWGGALVASFTVKFWLRISHRLSVVRSALRCWFVCVFPHSCCLTTTFYFMDTSCLIWYLCENSCGSLNFLKFGLSEQHKVTAERKKGFDLVFKLWFIAQLSVCASQRNLNEILPTHRSNQTSGQWWTNLLRNLNSNLHANSMKLKRTHLH